MHLIFNRRLFLLMAFGSVSWSSIAQNVDVNILKGINPRNPNSTYWKTTSGSVFWLSPSIFIGEAGYGLIARDKQALHRSLELLESVFISTAISEAIKVTVNRERPADKYPGVIFQTSATHGKSFPSGHSTLAFATATTLSLEYRKWYITVPAYLWAFSVDYSRLYLGKHYPTDVFAGAVVGAGSAYLTHWLNTKVFARSHAPAR